MRISDWSSDVCSSDLPVTVAVAAARPEIAAPVALDGIDDPRDRHPAAMRQKLLPLSAHEQREIDRLRHEQHHRAGKDELADKAERPQAAFHAVGPMRLTSQESVYTPPHTVLTTCGCAASPSNLVRTPLPR